MGAELDDTDYRTLLHFRTGLRRFLSWSAEQAREAGLTPKHHQLLLAIRGHDHERGPTISDVAGYLFLRHHSAVELVDRAEAAGLVRRVRDPDDPRSVRLTLTDLGAERLAKLAQLHRDELARVAPELTALWDGLKPRSDG